MFRKIKNTLFAAFAASSIFAVNVFAEPETTQQTATPAQMIASFLPMILILVVFYFLLIRPQRKKDKALREMIANLKVGDTVATIGGIQGKILKIKDNTFVIETGSGTNKSTITMDRNAISRLLKEGSNKAAEVAPLPDEEETSESTEA